MVAPPAAPLGKTARRTRRRLQRRAGELRRGVLRFRGATIVHFIHIRKTGGNAIRTTIRSYPAGAGYRLETAGHKRRLADIPEGDKFFFVLRDPIARFVSGFYSRQRCGRPANYVPWTRGEARAFARFDTPESLALALGEPDGEGRRAAEDALGSIPHLRWRYPDWFGGEDALYARRDDVIAILRQERLTADFEALRTRLGLPAAAALPGDPNKAHRNLNRSGYELSPQAHAILRERLAADYAFIAFCERELGLPAVPDPSSASA